MIRWRAGGSCNLFVIGAADSTPDLRLDEIHYDSDSAETGTAYQLEDWTKFSGANPFVETDEWGITLVKKNPASTPQDTTGRVSLPLVATWPFQVDGSWVLQGWALRYWSQVSELEFELVVGSRATSLPTWDPIVTEAATVGSTGADVTFKCSPLVAPQTSSTSYELFYELFDETSLTDNATAALRTGLGTFYPDIGRHPQWPTSIQDRLAVTLRFPTTSGNFGIRAIGLIYSSH